MVAPPLASTEREIDLDKILSEKMAEMPLKSAVSEIVKEYGLNKNEVYRQAVKIKDAK